ncbi:WXG100 family type VII secretion target [Arthrobacter sp. NPDC090010]|uniref:WXG100 family type VII secretion target n=1 Tax=Arthrobacter sp. NPDC090010 TaxID=3363942 RepID=UPI003830EFD3
MSVISVDTELLIAQSGSVRASMERISSDVKAMRQGLSALQSTWRGSAANNFQTLMAEWSATQSRVEASLAAINTALTQAASHYRDVEQLNTQRFTH